MILLLITTIFLFFYCSLFIYYFIGWLDIKEYYTSQNSNTNQTTISVIIPARNEEANIRKCIDTILKQKYPKHLFELIIIDDHSSDHTGDFVLSYKNENITLIKLSDELHGQKINSYKKKAIELAIAKAKGKLIVTTDADCIVSSTWLKTIADFYEKFHPYFIAAPVAFHNENSLLKIFQSLDFLSMQGITAAAVGKKFQSMCNGANLAYEKKIFEEVGGFHGIDTIASGDDMLLMHKIFKKYPDKVMFLKSREAIVKTNPVNSISAFFNQRIRWASKADKYDDKKITIVLILVYLFNFFLFASTLTAAFIPSLWQFCLTIWAIKIGIELILVIPVAHFFSKKSILLWFIPLQPLHVIYILISGWLGKFGNYTWKERKVK